MRRKLACRIPRGMLGLEETPKLLVRELDVEVAEELAHEPGVLDLLNRPGRPEELLVTLAEVRDEVLELWKSVAADRLQPGAVARLDRQMSVSGLDIRPVPQRAECPCRRGPQWRPCRSLPCSQPWSPP